MSFISIFHRAKKGRPVSSRNKDKAEDDDADEDEGDITDITNLAGIDVEVCGWAGFICKF